MKQTYSADNIETLNFKEAVQKRIAMYLGSADMNGVYQGVRETITNSIDEYTIGENNYIQVLVDGNIIKVIDRGRGVPFGKRSDGTEAMIAAFTEAHSGGKFDEKSYQNVAGLNGIGIKATSLSSEKFYAQSYRDGQVATLKMENGVVKDFSIKKATNSQRGTIVEFTPSPKVFNLEPVKIDFEVIKDMCETWAYLSPGLTFHLGNKQTKEEVVYNFKNGVADLIKNRIEKPIHKTIITNKMTDENGNTIEIALQWSRKRREVPFVFTNGLENPDGGTSLTGARTSLTRTVNNLAGVKLTGDSVRMGLHYAISASVKNPSFSNQTKSKVNNPELRGLADRTVAEALQNFAETHKKEWEDIIDILVREEEAEKAAEKAREKILNTEKDMITASNRRTNMDLPSKVADATNKTGYRELMLTEGDSASGMMKKTRDAKTQGIMPLKGKILNTYDLELHEAYENEEVRAIFTLLACGAGSVYNAKKLRYDKVIIATDGDSDGNHIAILIIGMFLKHAPKLIQDGKLWKLIPPFYGVGTGRNYKFLYSEQELKDYEAKHGKQTKLDRFKGLGAMSEEEVEKYLMDPDFRQLRQIRMEDIEEMRELFDTLLGKDIDGRRYLVSEGKLYE